MSIQINLNQPPFSFLSTEQRQWLTQRLDLVFFQADQVILDEGQVAPGLFIVYKGVVEESDGQGQVFSQYGSEDIFDVRAVLESACKHRYTACEETLCYLLRADDFIKLLDDSDDFSIYFKTDLGTQASLVEQRDSGVSEFILARIDDSAMRPPVYVNGQTNLARVAELMHEQKYDAVLVRSSRGVGIVTGTDLLKATLMGDKTKQTRVAEIAQYDLITVEYGEFLFSALLQMTQYQIERVVVRRQGDIVGMLELMDMLSLFSTHSHVIAMRIEQSRSLKELVVAAQRLDTLIRSLSEQGVKMAAIMELVTTLNRRLLQRAFDLIFPPRLRDRVCILVLGSEGRGEQILKTDQDNAVILKHEHEREAVMPLLNQLHQALLEFGYPPCPGGVMFINDSWINTVEGWQGKVGRWLNSGSPDAMMNMAILMDGEPVCGDKNLFDDVKARWQHSDLRSSMISAWFAKPALQFETPLTFLGKIREDHGKIDIKKGGIFPLVHGVRALAFEHAVDACNTLERLDWLQQHQILDEEVVQGLKDALLLFVRIRLRQQLAIKADNPGLSQQLNLEHLRSVDRSLLRHALHRVKKFKQLLVHHYHLENF
jgi:CBS domain-containing protein